MYVCAQKRRSWRTWRNSKTWGCCWTSAFGDGTPCKYRTTFNIVCFSSLDIKCTSRPRFTVSCSQQQKTACVKSLSEVPRTSWSEVYLDWFPMHSTGRSHKPATGNKLTPVLCPSVWTLCFPFWKWAQTFSHWRILNARLVFAGNVFIIFKARNNAMAIQHRQARSKDTC